jgi:CRISPR-associated endoribonuclease Cas6
MSALRGLIYDWLLMSDPEMASLLHKIEIPKPYAISPIFPSGGGTGRLEITNLAPALDDLFIFGIQNTAMRGSVLKLGADAFSFTLSEAGFERIDYEKIAEGIWDDSGFSFRMLTPTATHVSSEGRGDKPPRKTNPLPEPDCYFTYWLRKWNYYAPPELKLDTSAVTNMIRRNLAISKFRGGTQSEWLWEEKRRRPFIGFVGEVRFEVLKPKEVGQEGLSVLAALARFADFSGTGVETTRGMGQTRFLGMQASDKL